MITIYGDHHTHVHAKKRWRLENSQDSYFNAQLSSLRVYLGSNKLEFTHCVCFTSLDNFDRIF